MQRIGNHRIATLVVVAFALLALAPLAVARDGEHVKGDDYLRTKNVAQQTLELEDTTVRVSPETRIYDAKNRRISFRQIDEPKPRAKVLVEYEGTERAGMIDARKVVVRLAPQ